MTWRTAFWLIAPIVRHHAGTLSAIPPNRCPASLRNPVRYGPVRAPARPGDRTGRLQRCVCDRSPVPDNTLAGSWRPLRPRSIYGPGDDRFCDPEASAADGHRGAAVSQSVHYRWRHSYARPLIRWASLIFADTTLKLSPSPFRSRWDSGIRSSSVDAVDCRSVPRSRTNLLWPQLKRRRSCVVPARS